MELDPHFLTGTAPQNAVDKTTSNEIYVDVRRRSGWLH